MVILCQICQNFVIFDIMFSQGSVDTHCRWGGKYDRSLVANLLMSPIVKKNRKPLGLIIYQSYERISSGTFLWPTVYFRQKGNNTQQQRPTETEFCVFGRKRNQRRNESLFSARSQNKTATSFSTKDENENETNIQDADEVSVTY